MDSYTLFFVGCIVGMQHALEADHLAAMAALSTGSTSRRAMVLRGGVWGLGHTFTLLTICGALLMLGESISARTTAILEFSVGLMIIALGANVLFKLFRHKAHFHFHRHEPKPAHVHIHTHAADAGTHADNAHRHEHTNLGLGRALVVGMVHGSAGSAGLLVFAAAAHSVQQAIGYVFAFGVGSMIGMATLSFVVSYPLGLMQRYANWLNTATFAGLGCLAIIIGSNLLGDSWSSL
jgi:hypothetical protein